MIDYKNYCHNNEVVIFLLQKFLCLLLHYSSNELEEIVSGMC